MHVPFNRPLVLGGEADTIAQALAHGELAGGGQYTKRCEAWLSTHANATASFLTPSCTHALEMAALAEMRSNFDFDALDDNAQLSYRLFEYGAEQSDGAFPYRNHWYVFSQFTGPHSSIPAFLSKFIE